MVLLTLWTSVAEEREEEEDNNNTADLGLASGGEDLTITISRFVGPGVLFLVDGLCLVFAFFAIIFNLIKRRGRGGTLMMRTEVLMGHLLTSKPEYYIVIGRMSNASAPMITDSDLDLDSACWIIPQQTLNF